MTPTPFKTEIEPDECCGCRVCENVCPVKSCITMEPDADGFVLPRFDADICINCRLCAKACPSNLNNGEQLFYEPPATALAVVHNDAAVHAESSSGGAFTAIAEIFREGGGPCVIFGATMDDNLRVVYTSVTSIDELGRMRRSKYVQADALDSYRRAKELLRAGARVIFCGNPCYVAGLRLYLRRDYEKLLCVDFLCHGVPSQQTFDAFIADLEKKYRKKVAAFTFRDKGRRFGLNSCSFSTITFADGTRERTEKSDYLRCYADNFFTREACHKCRFTKTSRVADITLGDFWKIEAYDKTFDSGKGVSMILANSKKGQAVAARLPEFCRVSEIPLQVAVDGNPPLWKMAIANPNRRRFLNDLKSGGLAYARKRNMDTPPFFKRCIAFATRPLPPSVRATILRRL